MPRRVVLAGAAGGLIIAALVMLGVVEPLELALYDRLFEWRGPRPPRTGIVIVAIDDASVRELDQWPFTRATYARVIDRVRAGVPLAIGLDLIFDTPSVLGGEDDAAFGAAVTRAGNVVLAAAPLTEDLGFMATFDLHMPIRGIRAGARHVGHVSNPLDRDGGMRAGLISSPESYQGLPAFGIAVLDVAKHAGMPVARIPTSPTARVNFRGAPRTFPRVSFYRVLRGEVGADVFRGKIVLVGATGALIHDSVRTPFAHVGGMPGVEFLANLIETLAVGNHVREVPALLSAVVALLAGVALGLLARRRPGLALPFAAVVIVVIVGAAYFTFVLFDVWFRVAGPALAFALALVFTVAPGRVSVPAAER